MGTGSTTRSSIQPSSSDPSPLDMDLVERIEFIPGPGGAVYGQNAMFGVINVVTRDGGSVNGTELAVGVRQPQRETEGRVSHGRKLESGLNLLLSVSGQRARGEDRYQDFGSSSIAGVAAGLDGERDRELFAKISKGDWSFQHLEGKRRKDDPTGGYFSDPLVAGQYQADHFALTQLTYQTAITPTLHGTARVFTGAQRYTADFFYDGARFSSPAESRWYGSELRLVSTAIARHKLMVGLEGQKDAKRDQYFLDRAEPANDVAVRGSGYRAGIYAQDEWQLRDDLVATLGLRLDRTGEGGSHASPRSALIWRAAPTTTLKALYGRAHRKPNAYERDYSDGVSQIDNRSLRGETIDTLEFVVDQRVGSDLALRASVYQWRIRNLITLGIEPDSGLTQYQSGENVKAQGLELSADKTWRIGARLRGSVAFQGVEQADGDRLINSPRMLVKLNFSAPLPWYGLRLGYQWHYGSGRLSGDGTELGGFALSHLYLSTGQLAPGLDVAIGIHNLFDKRYSHPASDSNWQNALQQPGRAAMLRLGYRF